NKLTDLIRVRFTDAQQGWIVGEHGQIFRTTDAGFNWVEEASPVKRSLMALSFPHTTAGWAAGEGGTIISISPGRR
ncbi:MAG: hypothetical protein WBC46_16180, partial [Nitrospira sp.]